MSAKHKTPIIRQPRTKGGTLYVFPSATEDIGLNLNERRNKVILSHYALLNIPVSDSKYSKNDILDNTRNRFNPTNIPGHYASAVDSSYKRPGHILAASLQNYALNFETVLRNQRTYDYSSPVTVSERVFWKWLKETGAIRWVYNKNSNTFIEEPEITINAAGEAVQTGYSRVVQSIGEIKSGANTYDTFGVFNETYVNIPSSYGGSTQYFKQYIDDNYQLGTAYKTSSFLEGNESLDPAASNSGDVIFTENIPYTDITADKKSNGRYSTLAGSLIPWWFEREIKNFPNTDDPEAVMSAYITDPYLDVASLSETDMSTTLYYEDTDSNGVGAETKVTRQFNRSNIDSLSLVTNISELRQIYGVSMPNMLKQEGLNPMTMTYDDIAIILADKSEFEFNTVLLYYSIFDQSGRNVIATNLFGVLFTQAPVDDSDNATRTGGVSKFHLPVYKKVKSDSDGFGTSYSLRVNIKTFDVYDNTEAVINDRTTNSSLIEENFNSVLHNLAKSVDILQRSVNTNSFIKSKYAEFDVKADKILRDNVELKKMYDNIINSKTTQIKTKHLISEDLAVQTIRPRTDLDSIGNESKIEFVIPTKDYTKTYDYNNLTEFEKTFIDTIKKDLVIESNQASSYRFDSVESGVKDGFQKLEYRGTLLGTSDAGIISKIKDIKGLKKTESDNNDVGDDSYILDLLRNKIDVKFAESVNPIDTSLDSSINLLSQDNQNVSAYVNRMVPELVISPASKAFDDIEGFVPELLKYVESSVDANDGKTKITKAEVNYIKLIPYIVKVIQMLDPDKFISKSSIKIKSQQVPDLEHKKTTICLDADCSMADPTVSPFDNILDRLSFNIDIKKGNLKIAVHYPLIEGTNPTFENNLKRYLTNAITYDTIAEAVPVTNLQNLTDKQKAALIVISYMCKKRVKEGLKPNNVIKLTNGNTGSSVTISDADTIRLSNLAWIWFDYQNKIRNIAIDPNRDNSQKIDAISDIIKKEPGTMVINSKMGYTIFDGSPLAPGTKKSDISSSLPAKDGLYVTMNVYAGDGDSVSSTYNLTTLPEVFSGSNIIGSDKGQYTDGSRYAFVDFILDTTKTESAADGSATTTSDDKKLTFCIRQRPNIVLVVPAAAKTPLVYTKDGKRIMNDNTGQLVEPEIIVEAVGTIPDEDGVNRINFDHDENNTFSIEFDDEGNPKPNDRLKS